MTSENLLWFLLSVSDDDKKTPRMRRQAISVASSGLSATSTPRFGKKSGNIRFYHVHLILAFNWDISFIDHPTLSLIDKFFGIRESNKEICF